jgi:hypothetical protein
MHRAVAHDIPRLGAVNGLTTKLERGSLVPSLQRFAVREHRPTKYGALPPSS